MADIKELPEKIENEKNEECLLKDSKLLGDQLLYKLCYDNPKTREGWFKLHEDVLEFLKSDNSELQKLKLMQYTEMLAMVVNGYRSMH